MPPRSPQPDDVAIGVLEDGRLDQLVVLAVIEELAVSHVGPAPGDLALIRDPRERAAVAAVRAAIDSVARFLGIRGHEDLVLPPACEPWPVALVALGRSAIPVPAAVATGKHRVVRQIDAGVVYAAAC